MEFSGIGVIPYEPPDLNLKPFVRRKHHTGFKAFTMNTPGILHRSMLMLDVDFKIKQFPKEEREEQRLRRIRLWDFILLHGKDSISEEEFLNEWVNNRVFAPAEARQRLMETHRNLLDVYIDGLDLNHNGVIELDEWCLGTPTLSDETKKVGFETLDVDKDGVISPEEFKYGMIYWTFSSPPGNPFNFIFGPFVEED